ncbi:MAG: response regulator transcription factor [Bryobacterales bacterium]|nr:response regulator transcription factor [Bryobacterales bacterium]
MSRIRTAILEVDPIFASGLKAALSGDDEFTVTWVAHTLDAAMGLLRQEPCDLLLATPMSGLSRTMELLMTVRARSPRTRVLLWDMVISDVAKRQMERTAAASWINRKVSPEALRRILREELAAGEREPAPLSESENSGRRLTAREREVISHVQMGMKNREIAEAMGITPGTVKVHLMHIFEKTGLRDRIQLAQYAPQLLAPPASEARRDTLQEVSV